MKKILFIFLLFYFNTFMIYGHEKKFFLGVTVMDVPEAKKKKISYLDTTGAIILKLTERSPAKIGGLLVGDVILQIDENKINSFYDVIKYISNYNGIGFVVIKVLRNNNFYEYKIKLAEKS